MSSELTTPQTNFVFSSDGQDTVALLSDSARTRDATSRMGSSLHRFSAPRAATRHAVVESTRSIMNSLLNIPFQSTRVTICETAVILNSSWTEAFLAVRGPARHPISALAPLPGHPLHRRVALSTAHRHGRRA